MAKQLGPHSNTCLMGTPNINTRINACTSGTFVLREQPFDFVQKIVQVVESAGVHGGFLKYAGDVYEPIHGCPCAYKIRCTYREFIAAELQGVEAFKRNPGRVKDLVMFMTDFSMVEMACFKPDLNLLSFANGVLELSCGRFTPYLGMDTQEVGGLAAQMARHHIPLPYTGSVDTPLLDIILDLQFGYDVSELLLALIGRCFFKIGERDGWQVIPFLAGIGETGKSLVLNIVDAVFAPGKVGNLAARREVFGMAKLVNKEVVLGRDMPAKMSASLPEEIMQSMIAGDSLEISRKGLTALQVQWTAPVIMAGNYMPDYIDIGDNIGCHIVFIRFDNLVANTQAELQACILEQELPNIVCRMLAAYNNYIRYVKASGGFWAAVPPMVLEWQRKFS